MFNHDKQAGARPLRGVYGGAGAPARASRTLQQRRHEHSATADREVISQAVLEAYYESKQQCFALTQQLKAEREAILAKLQSGAAVESGPFSADVRHFEQRPLTKANLVELLGEDEVELLRLQISPVERLRLYVRRTSHVRRNNKG